MNLFEFPITQSLFLLLALILAVLWIPNIIASVYVSKIYLADTARPRNQILRSILYGVVTITATSTIIAALVFDFWIGLLFLQERLEVDFGSVMLALALVASKGSPLIFAWSLWRINGNAGAINAVPEPSDDENLTQTEINAVEDLKFGKMRRIVEGQHIRKRQRLDKKKK